MVVVFAHTAGLTGAEAGIAGGSRRARARSCSRRSSATRPCAASPSAPARSLEAPGARRCSTPSARRYIDLLDSLGARPGDARAAARRAPRRVDDLRFAGQRRRRTRVVSSATA